MTAADDTRTEIAAVLAAHDGTERRRTTPAPGISQWDNHCRCGKLLPWPKEECENTHRTHVAEVLAEYVATKQAEALREAAMDVPFLDPEVADEVIDWLRARTDRIAP